MDEKTLRITLSALGGPTVEVPPPRTEQNIRRRGARVRLRAGAPARLQFWDVTLLDLSRSGALIEHTQRIQVGDVYRLVFQLEGLDLTVKARVARSFASHYAPVAGGERQLVYRTGVEFTEVTGETTARISAYLGQVRTSEFSADSP
jgi:hypothetical protein